MTPGGGFGGGQIGYNWQGALGGGNTVFGIEADFQGGDIYNQLIDAAGNSFKSELDYFGTVRARLGYASDRSLYYVTGGLAYGGLKNQAEIGGTNYSTSPPQLVDESRISIYEPRGERSASCRQQQGGG